MRIILDNIIFSLQKTGGISGAWAILIKELLKTDSDNILFVEREDACENIFRTDLNIPSDRIIKRKRLPLNADRYMPVRLEGEDAPFIFHSSYYRTCSSPKALNVITLHDFIYEQARTHSFLATAVHSFQKKKALRRAAAIACVSNDTLSQLKQRMPDLSDKVMTTVIPNPPVCMPAKQEILNPNTDNKFLLYVGGRESYKNFMQAAKAAETTHFPLIIAGAPLTVKEQAILNKECPSLKYRVDEFPTPEHLSHLYATAFCLLYPSSHEGFGIPIVEAQAHGCPVIIGPCAACKEVGGDAVLSANSSHTIADNIVLLNDRRHRYALIERGRKNITRFQPALIANQYRSLYKFLIN